MGETENTLLPNGPPDDAALVQALDFGPVLDEQVRRLYVLGIVIDSFIYYNLGVNG